MAVYDYLIVGSGLFGSTFAHLASKAGKRCLVIDKRQHTGGNVHCRDVEGINVHEYGAHIFHTSNKAVWDFVNSIVEFNRFTNSPIARFKGEIYNLPFNMNTFHQMWGVSTPEEAREMIDRQKADALSRLKADGADAPRNLEEQARILVGDDIFEKLIKGYTEKQWGRPCSELPAFIIRRLPVRFVYDNNYFKDDYQGIPKGGYNKLVDGLLEGVECRTSVDFFDDRTYWESVADRIVFTGKIDQYFNHSFGKLDYRTLRFEHKVMDVPDFQGNAVVNYTEAEIPFTRIIEHKHFEMFGDDVYRIGKTVVTREYPSEWNEGMEPFYPVNDSKNSSLYLKYKELADKERNVRFGGRLAEYRYYDMAPVIESAFKLFEDERKQG